MVARIADVVKERFSAHFTGVIHDDIAKAEQPLGNARRDGDILNFAEGNVACRPGHQSGIDFDFCVRQRVANHIATQVVISRN